MVMSKIRAVVRSTSAWDMSICRPSDVYIWDNSSYRLFEAFVVLGRLRCTEATYMKHLKLVLELALGCLSMCDRDRDSNIHDPTHRHPYSRGHVCTTGTPTTATILTRWLLDETDIDLKNQVWSYKTRRAIAEA
ncbi:hypothetical protein CONLIGDRAFT_45235 [Coniochaeta ligniaria NRRL 30616]|uniref:Uncharacterized protein n=1 Tax=Coniochaeta ligniaria NRRL 30616 TaxID=1408157 RepID=A0A1J7J6T4_9PEZI|nr:hypothetical protein CONLIGDRAFT_45235 [Coniochaeta ligniaria NRRL 30616]